MSKADQAAAHAEAFAKAFGLEVGGGLADLDKFAQYASDPVGFIEAVLRMSLTVEQRAIAASVRDNRETNVQAAHGVGKTALAGALVLWWVMAVRGLAITTAPTARQVRKLLWGEIRKRHGQCGLPGVCNTVDLKVVEKVEAFGFTASDTNKNAFQGIHEDLLLIVQDEACGISPDIDEGASSCATGTKNRMLRIGNPVSPGTPFERSCKITHQRIPAWNHPNVAWAYEVHGSGYHRLKPEVAAAIVVDGEVLDQDDWPEWCQRDVIGGAISVAWIEEVRAKYGEGSVFWTSRVEGRFPLDSGDSIIPQSWVLAAIARYSQDPARWEAMAKPHPLRYGLDVADGGDDHALAAWQGPVLRMAKAHPTQGDREDVTRAAGLLGKELRANPSASGAIDRGGVGAGAVGILIEQDLSVRGLFWGEAARDNDQYLNLKAEQFWLLREAFRVGEVAIASGEWDEAIEDFSAIWYELTSKGLTRIEDKKKTRKRLGRSPNVGDAIVLAYHCVPPDIEITTTGQRASVPIGRVLSRRGGRR